MNTYAVYFKPLTPLASWPLGSDTLAGAVCWRIRLLGLMDDDALSHWLETQQDQPRFAFSQAFPVYFGPEKPIRFYPRPAHFQPTAQDYTAIKANATHDSQKALSLALAKVAKELKKVPYVTEGAFRAITSGVVQPGDLLRKNSDPQQPLTIKAGAFCLKEEAQQLPNKLLDSEPIQHNQIDRVAGATVEGALFYQEEWFFIKGGGLWALLRADSSDMENFIAPALRLLQDTGLGGNRSTGKGFFEITIEPFTELPEAASPRFLMTLSRYLPALDENIIIRQPVAYTLKSLRPKREQRFPRPTPGQSPAIYKEPIRVFEPGSVFSRPDGVSKTIYGRWARVTPLDHPPVYQSGAAIMVAL
ncbi:MAG: type III-A CRISPR-associated RAMP protein Csm4 [Thermanaerothrix sp.]|uniref:type III-A CRISPR-associated RAMP protein Csm4 n=1 Tax=Thermanaerothrix sp. TaxID=2972675 RepID=UPI003C7B8A1B